MTEIDRQEVADLLLEGAPLDDVEAVLRSAGLNETEALEQIEGILCSPIFRAARPKVQLGQRLALAAQLHQRVTQQNGIVPRHRGLSPKQFYEGWLAHHQPVVLEDFTPGWPALDWTPEVLADRLGDQSIEVLIGRDQAAHPDRDFSDLRQEVSPQQWARLLRQNDHSNDLYLVARNHLMQSPAGSALLSDTPIGDAWVKSDSLPSCCSLWMGPKGTFTALHHDTCHALFVQLVGRKRFRLASPLIPDLLEAIEPFYHRHRALSDICPREQILEAEIGPGEALFLPVGWWHEASALSLSIGMSFNGLHAANDYEDYCPGKL